MLLIGNRAPDKIIEVVEVRHKDSSKRSSRRTPDTFVTFLMDHKSQKMDLAHFKRQLRNCAKHKECQSIVGVMSLLQSGSYIYVVDRMLLFSTTDIGKTFKLRDIKVDEMAHTCALSKHNRIVGTGFVRCLCDKRFMEEEIAVRVDQKFRDPLDDHGSDPSDRDYDRWGAEAAAEMQGGFNSRFDELDDDEEHLRLLLEDLHFKELL